MAIYYAFGLEKGLIHSSGTIVKHAIVNPGHILLLGYLTLLHSERPKLYRVLAFLSAIGLN